MIGCYDFCGHYEWTFAWLEAEGGHELVLEYWDEAIRQDSQQHAAKLIESKGFAGMREYWGHVLEEEAAGYHVTEAPGVFRIDMHACPSKGFLIHNGLVQYRDYCDHCMGWIGGMLKAAGYVIDHQHNHAGQCWWEMRKQDDEAPSPTLDHDVTTLTNWQTAHMDSYHQATNPDDKV